MHLWFINYFTWHHSSSHMAGQLYISQNLPCLCIVCTASSTSNLPKPAFFLCVPRWPSGQHTQSDMSAVAFFLSCLLPTGRRAIFACSLFFALPFLFKDCSHGSIHYLHDQIQRILFGVLAVRLGNL